MKYKQFLSVILIVTFWATIVFAQKDKANYVPRSKSPVLKQIKESMDAENAVKDSITKVIRDNQEEKAKEKKENRKVLRADFKNVKKPADKEAFKSVFHFDPIPQDQSGMCWCFSTTSFLETEVKRLTGQEIKLSEVHTVYYQYLAKATRFIDERGDSYFAEGSQSNAVFEMMDAHGAVPAEVYTGLKKYDKHNHAQMFEDIKDYLNFCKEQEYWEKDVILGNIKNILHQYIGTPPTSFEWNGKTYTPLEFKNDVLKINSDDYVAFVSTLSFPFYIQGVFDVPDNWWHDDSYYNIPLDEWYNLIVDATKSGYSLSISGDISDPGYCGQEDAAYIPDFIMPQDHINQYSREYGIYSGISEDDHALHLIGVTQKSGYDWFLIKDSWYTSTIGRDSLKGYFMWRGDYIKIKMLAYVIHKDIAKNILAKCK